MIPGRRGRADRSRHGSSGGAAGRCWKIRSVIGTLNALVDHLEAQLVDGDPAGEVARVAGQHGTTEYHLRRMFTSLAGMPVSEYVRARRMTLAATALVTGTDDLLGIAVRYGYSSTEAFSRAFRTVHGVAPSTLREAGGPIRTQHIVRFRLTVEGSAPMDVRIVDTPTLWFAGHAARIPLIYKGVNPHAAELVESVTHEQNTRLLTLAAGPDGTEPHGILAVNGETEGDLGQASPEGSMLTYLHGVALTEPPPEDLDRIEVSAGSWAVFHTSGPFPETLQSAFAATATDWFPSNPWRLRPGPSVVATLGMNDEHTRADCEIWMPVEPETR